MLRVRVNWSGTGVVGNGLSTHYFIHTEDQAGADAAGLAIANYWGAVDAQIGNATSWTLDPVVAVINPAGVQTGQFTVAPASGSGALNSSYGPFASQGLVSWRTGTFNAGKELRGRTFVPGVQVISMSGGSPSAAYISAINTANAALVADVNTAFAIWSKLRSTAASVTSGSTWNKFAVLRSRRD